MADLMGGVSFVSTAAKDIFQYNCFFQGVTLDYPMFVLQILTLGLTPIVFGGFVFLAFCCLRVIKKSRFKDTYIRNSVCVFMVMTFLLYPSITTSTFELFNCSSVMDA